MRVNNKKKAGFIPWDDVLGISKHDLVCPMDIDGMLERNGHFLFLEYKELGKGCSRGQQIAYEALARVPCHTVIYVWGDYRNWIVTQAQILGHHDSPRACDNLQLARFITNWLNAKKSPVKQGLK